MTTADAAEIDRIASSSLIVMPLHHSQLTFLTKTWCWCDFAKWEWLSAAIPGLLVRRKRGAFEAVTGSFIIEPDWGTTSVHVVARSFSLALRHGWHAWCPTSVNLIVRELFIQSSDRLQGLPTRLILTLPNYCLTSWP